jgi:peroxiredoxin
MWAEIPQFVGSWCELTRRVSGAARTTFIINDDTATAHVHGQGPGVGPHVVLLAIQVHGAVAQDHEAHRRVGGVGV